VLRLPNEGELTLTWARFHAPSGYGLSRRGVMPDICTSGYVTKSDEVLNMLRTGAQRLLDDPALFALARGVTHNTATVSSGLAAAAATAQ
jgi:hypothetical protein